MKRQITINLINMRKSGLTVEEFFLLQLIHDGVDISGFIFTNLDEIIEKLEKDLYIKVLDLSLELRAKGHSLFSVDNEAEIDEVLTYFKENTNIGQRFNIKTKAYREFVSGRLAEGNTVDDMKAIIDIKFSEWAGTDMEKYIRPSTLFSPKNFANYLLQLDRLEGGADVDYTINV